MLSRSGGVLSGFFRGGCGVAGLSAGCFGLKDSWRSAWRRKEGGGLGGSLTEKDWPDSIGWLKLRLP